MRNLFFMAMLMLCTSCTLTYDKVSVVTPFDINKYLGKWHEIARQDHSFERDLVQVTADYEFADETRTKITVVNKGLNHISKQWQQATGVAKFVDSENSGDLKVSFFGPFYGAYQIHDIVEQNGKYVAALIIGPDTNYIWFLGRTTTLAEPIKQRFIRKLKQLDVDTDKLIWLKDMPQSLTH